MATAKWGNEHVRKLRRLWPTEMPPTEIAKRLGVSTNFVVRKAAELHLPPRAGPPPTSPSPPPSAEDAYLLAEAARTASPALPALPFLAATAARRSPQ
jgi:hypothetical protein